MLQLLLKCATGVYLISSRVGVSLGKEIEQSGEIFSCVNREISLEWQMTRHMDGEHDHTEKDGMQALRGLGIVR